MRCLLQLPQELKFPQKINTLKLLISCCVAAISPLTGGSLPPNLRAVLARLGSEQNFGQLS
jgi:hypothetical protein